MSAPPAPNFITKALEDAMRHDPEARWSDTAIFAQAVWDSLLAEGTLDWITKPGVPLRRYLVVPLMEGEAKPHA